jgi:hypothetical protein
MIILENISFAWETDTDADEDPSLAGVLTVSDQPPANIENPNYASLDLDVVVIEVEKLTRKALVGSKMYWNGHMWVITAVSRLNEIRRLYIRRWGVKLKSHRGRCDDNK